MGFGVNVAPLIICNDHSLTSIIDTRKKKKISTLCAFIDFGKAYDFINRDKLWFRLYDTGVRCHNENDFSRKIYL